MHLKRPGMQVLTVCIFDLKTCSTIKTEQFRAVSAVWSRIWYEVSWWSIKFSTPFHIRTTQVRWREAGGKCSPSFLQWFPPENLQSLHNTYIQYIKNNIDCRAEPTVCQAENSNSSTDMTNQVTFLLQFNASANRSP